MKSESTSHAKNVAIQQVSSESLAGRISEWADRIARRAYEIFAGSGFTSGHDLENWLKAERELLSQISLEVEETKDDFVVKAEVPGFNAEDLDIHLCGPRLIIEGRHENPKGKAEKDPFCGDRGCESRQIYQMVELPGPVLTDDARAELKNAVLRVHLPKAEKAGQIKIAAA
jgi:HSP20 family molecular chaperone IbpA